MTIAVGFERYLEAAVPGECPDGLRLVLWGAWIAGAAQACKLVNGAQTAEDMARVFGSVNDAAATLLRGAVEVSVVPVLGRQARRH